VVLQTNTNMEARVDFDEPQLVVENALVFNKGLMGKTFKTQNKDIVENLGTFNETQRVELKSKLDKDGKVCYKRGKSSLRFDNEQ
jgi:glycyl-tRNA synthetase (class II)